MLTPLLPGRERMAVSYKSWLTIGALLLFAVLAAVVVAWKQTHSVRLDDRVIFVAWGDGEIARTATREEAVRKWSKVTWREDGLHVGEDGEFFLPRNQLESHR